MMTWAVESEAAAPITRTVHSRPVLFGHTFASAAAIGATMSEANRERRERLTPTPSGRRAGPWACRNVAFCSSRAGETTPDRFPGSARHPRIACRSAHRRSAKAAPCWATSSSRVLTLGKPRENTDLPGVERPVDRHVARAERWPAVVALPHERRVSLLATRADPTVLRFRAEPEPKLGVRRSRGRFLHGRRVCSPLTLSVNNEMSTQPFPRAHADKSFTYLPRRHQRQKPRRS